MYFLSSLRLKLDRSISVIKRWSWGVPEKMYAQGLRKGMEGILANFTWEDNALAEKDITWWRSFSQWEPWTLHKYTCRFLCAYWAQSSLLLAGESEDWEKSSWAGLIIAACQNSHLTTLIFTNRNSHLQIILLTYFTEYYGFGHVTSSHMPVLR